MSKIRGILKTARGTAGRSFSEESRETDKDLVRFR